MYKSSICFVTGDRGQPSVYVRCWAPYFYNAILFKQSSILVDFIDHTPIPDTYDVYVISRCCADTKLVESLYKAGKKIILEFDDPLWKCASVPYSVEGDILTSADSVYRRLKAQVKYASGVIVSTDNLGKAFRDDIDKNVPILVMYNSIQEIHPIENHNKTVFYGGCTQDKIKMFNNNWFEALDEMYNRGYDIVSSVDIPVHHTKFELCSWPSYLTTVAKHKPEYYVAPLSECIESNCKSNLKELEAWQLGCKFIGQGDPYRNGLRYNASTDEILKAFDDATVPTFESKYLVTDHDFICKWLTAYSGKWGR